MFMNRTKREKAYWWFLLGTGVLISPYTLTRNAINSQKRQNEKRRSRERSNRPPKPVKRGRDPGLPLEAPTLAEKIGLKKQRKVEAQNESAFMKLPAEIREMIYAAYIGVGEIEIADSYDVYQRRLTRSFKEEDLSFPILGRRSTPETRPYSPYEQFTPIDILPLLVSCRRIYTELLTYFYTIPTFTFLFPHAFLLFTSILPEPALHTIRHLNLSFSSGPPMRTRDFMLPAEKRSSSFSSASLESDISFSFLHNPHIKVLNNSLPKPPGRTLISVHWPPEIYTIICWILVGMKCLRTLELNVKDTHFRRWRWKEDAEDCVLKPLSDITSSTELVVTVTSERVDWLTPPELLVRHRKRFTRVQQGGETQWEQVDIPIIIERM